MTDITDMLPQVHVCATALGPTCFASVSRARHADHVRSPSCPLSMMGPPFSKHQQVKCDKTSVRKSLFGLKPQIMKITATNEMMNFCNSCD